MFNHLPSLVTLLDKGLMYRYKVKQRAQAWLCCGPNNE